MAEFLYPTDNIKVHRHSSIDQFKGYLSVWEKGGWAPVIFDQLDGIVCETMKTHPVAISFGGDLGYLYPEAHCTYSSDHFIYVDHEGVEQKILPECFGGSGDFYDAFVKKFSFINFDGDNGGSSLGLHQTKNLRVGLSCCVAEETLPAVD